MRIIGHFHDHANAFSPHGLVVVVFVFIPDPMSLYNTDQLNYVRPCMTPSLLPLLVILALHNNLLLLLIIIIIEAADFVQAQNRLVGILDQHEAAVVLAAQTHVSDGADNTPAVGEGEVHLGGKVAGLPADDAKNDVLVVGLGVDTGNETRKDCVSMILILRNMVGVLLTQAS